MIKIFDATVRFFFFPVRWANAVSTWIQNVSSPDDSIKIRNTCSPKEGDSLKLTVNMNHIYDGVKEYFSDFFVTFNRLRETLDDFCDHNSIEVTEGQFCVSENWLADKMGNPHILELKVNLSSSGGTRQISKTLVYLPTTLKLVFAGTEYTVTGVTATDDEGWYSIDDRTSGDFWLVEGNTEKQLSFATAKSQDDAKLSYFVGNVASSDPWNVTQYKRACAGKAVVTDSGGGGGGTFLFTLKAVTKTVQGQKEYDYTLIYLTGTTLQFGTRTYNFRTGTGVGEITSVGNGWYKINGVTTGNIYIIEDGTTISNLEKTYYAKFASAGLSDANKFSIFVGYIGERNPWAISQKTPACTGTTSINFPLEHVSGANENLYQNEGENDSPPAADDYDTQTWERDVTGTYVYNSSTHDYDFESNDCNGISFQAITRIHRMGEAGDVLYMRRIYFDKNGMLYKVGAEQWCYKHKQTSIS